MKKESQNNKENEWKTMKNNQNQDWEKVIKKDFSDFERAIEDPDIPLEHNDQYLKQCIKRLKELIINLVCSTLSQQKHDCEILLNTAIDTKNKEIEKVRKDAIKEYLKTEEGKVYQDYLKLQEMARKDVVKEIRKIVGEYLTQWLRDFANRPLKERENPFNEVAKIRKALSDILTKLK